MAKPTTASASEASIATGEWLYFAAVMLIAAITRFWNLGSVAVEHFDEGVYASGIYCSHLEPAFEYPLRHLYAPPVWPSVLAETITWFGPGAVMIPCVLCGVATVALLWWIAREWYGPTGAAIASTLLALSDVHILFSRSALTDVPMTLLMSAGIYAGWKSITTRKLSWLVVSGVLAGVAWATKYNGWLTLAVIASASTAWRVVERGDTNVVNSRPIFRWFAIAAIAGAVWVPVLSSLDDVGGYAAVSENHRQFFVGLSGWWDSAMRQIRMVQLAASSGTVWPAVGLIGFGALAIRPLSQGIAFFAASVIGTRFRLLTFVVASVGTSVKSIRDLIQKVAETPARKLATWMTLAWLFGLTVAIPLYTPYLRLVVPLIPAGCLAWADLATRNDRTVWTNRSHVRAAFGLLALVLAIWTVGVFATARERAANGTEYLTSRGASQRVTETLLDEVPKAIHAGESRDVGLYVYGEPSVYFHAARLEGTKRFDYITQPMGNLGVLDRSRTDSALTPFVLVGPHGFELTPEIGDDPRLGWVAEQSGHPSLLVALDRASDEKLAQDEFRMPQLRYVLYRVRTAEEVDAKADSTAVK